MKTVEQLYEELRAAVDNGHESMTHEDALTCVRSMHDADRAMRAARPAEAQQPGVAGLVGALEDAQRAINSMKVEAETAAQGDEQMMLEACETISNEGLQADMAIRAALASHGQAPAQAAPAYKDSTPELHVGDSAFENWYSTYNPAHKADKQRARDAYAAGMGDPLVTAAPAAVAGPSEFPHEQMDVMALARYKVMPSHESMLHRHVVVAGDGSQQLYIGREVECENMARKFAGAFLDGAFAFHSMLAAAPATQQPTQAQAIPGVQWQCGPQASGFTAPQADSRPAPVRDYPPLPDFDTVEQHIYGACRRYITQDMLEPIHNLIRETVDADRAARAPADSVTAPAGGAAVPDDWPTDDELDTVLCNQWPAFSMQATLVRVWVRAAMRDALAKWGTPPAVAGEQVGWMWQHEEIGRTGFVDCWQVENGWQDGNPRLRLISKLYATPQPTQAQAGAVPLTDREIELIDGMIQVQLDHASRCDAIANRSMADKQKAGTWSALPFCKSSRPTASKEASMELTFDLIYASLKGENAALREAYTKQQELILQLVEALCECAENSQEQLNRMEAARLRDYKPNAVAWQEDTIAKAKVAITAGRARLEGK